MRFSVGFLVPLMFCVETAAFVSPSSTRSLHQPTLVKQTSWLPPTTLQTQCKSSSSSLQMALLNVPDGFFTISFGVAGFMLSLMRNLHRSRMEELAWEQRLSESREVRLAEDPTLLEADLLKQEAQAEWSAYGPEAMKERIKTRVAERLQEEEEEQYRRAPTEFKMTNEEIQQFQDEFGVDYDPYYDDPYTEEELPEDLKYRVDKKYGDRIYENGEIFYKDKETDMYYRQGSKPRIKGFW